jgi:hypothetical protein
MATIIKTTGELENTEPANNNIFTLIELQNAVNGFFIIVPIDTGEYSDKFMIVDEDGLIKSNPIANTKASKIAGQPIVGQVMIIDREQIE